MKLIIIECGGAYKSKGVLQLFCCDEGLLLLMLNLRFVHSCILSEVQSLDLEDSHEVARSQLGSVTLLKDLLVPLRHTAGLHIPACSLYT